MHVGQGITGQFMERLIEIAKKEGKHKLTLSSNHQLTAALRTVRYVYGMLAHAVMLALWRASSRLMAPMTMNSTGIMIRHCTLLVTSSASKGEPYRIEIQ